MFGLRSDLQLHLWNLLMKVVNACVNVMKQPIFARIALLTLVLSI